jgi:hypothetical protein
MNEINLRVTGKDITMNTNLNMKRFTLQKYLFIIILFIASSQLIFAQQFTMEQTLSDEAQRTTIAFDGLAFLTGSLGSDSFFPPGKVADFWGFQYLRDNDPSRMGHNTDFLTRASLNMLYVLTPSQRQDLIALANSQVDLINQYGYNRFVLMKAFRRLLVGDIPSGTTGLNRDSVRAYSAELYKLDGRMSFQRAHVMGTLLHSLTTNQKAYIDSMVGKGMLTWPVVSEPTELQGLSHDVKVAVMTYAGDMFSWYAGSVDADVYFCPERQGTYFGSFYMKDAPAVGNPNYSIDTNLTAGYGKKFLEVLTPAESLLVSSLLDIQRPYLYEIVDRRTDVSTQLRKFMMGEFPDSIQVLTLMSRYGELDGEIVYNFATKFALVNKMLTSIQRDTLMAKRREVLGDSFLYPTGAYIYASPIAIPEIINTDFLFTTADGTTKFYQVKNGWNMVSLPQQGVEVAGFKLFPTAISQIYAFNSGYKVLDTMKAGTGYWMKFASDQSIYLLGNVILCDTIYLHDGWNLIGSLGETIAVNNIVSDSSDVILSNIFGYNSKYEIVDSLKPCRGYWVKSKIVCKIILNVSGVEYLMHKVKIVDNGEMPPLPPNYSDGQFEKKPSSFALLQNYPNPFNPTTVIKYQLPVDSKVRIQVYNLLGQVVAQLEDSYKYAGVYAVEWGASKIASGIYFYYLEAVSITDSKNTFTDIKKMILMK